MFYDRTLQRWVPEGPPALSDDGTSYAYIDGDNKSSRLHLVDLRTKGDRILAQGGPWRVVGLRPDAVYVERVESLPYSEAYGVMVVSRGLSKVPFDGGVPVELTSDTRHWIVAGGAAWGGGSTFDVAGGPNDIVRLDLDSKKLTTWFAPGKRSRLLAIVAGTPLVMAEAADDQLWRVTSPGAAIRIWTGTDAMAPDYPIAVDGSVVWFSSRSQTPAWAIFRYSGDRGLQQVAAFADRPISVAGPCA